MSQLQVFKVERINANGHKVYLTKEGAFAGDINEWSDDRILCFASAAEAQHAARIASDNGKPCYVVDHTDYVGGAL